ncbi:MAG: calcium-binding protein [Cyanobacteria bacterium J06560_2]
MKTSTLSSIKVDTLVDENDGSLAKGDVSLREAIEAVKTGGRITFSKALANENAGFGKGVIKVNSAIAIDKSLTIQGLGADKLTVKGNKKAGVFLINDGDDAKNSQVVIEGLTISDGGTAGEEAASIFSTENLTIANASVVKNKGVGIGVRATNSKGGRLKVINSSLENNASSIDGQNEIAIANSTISGNRGNGIKAEGGYYTDDSFTGGITAKVSITDSVIVDSGVTAYAYGGGEIKITRSTISGDNSDLLAYNEYRGGAGDITVQDSLIEGASVSAIGGKAIIKDSIVSGRTGTNVGDGDTLVYGYSVNVQRSTITNGESFGIGASGAVKLTDSTVANNKAGGVNLSSTFYSGSLSLTADNSTIASNGNTRSEAGGIVVNSTDYYLDSVIRLKNTTITGNVGSTAGGVLIKSPTPDEFATTSVRIANTIIAGNKGPDIVADKINSLGYNLIGNSDGTTGFNRQGDLTGSKNNPLDPKLGTLQNNGGPTLTQKPLSGSPAINAGNPKTNSPKFDQRGSGFNRVIGGTIDIGAVESKSTAPSRDELNGTNRKDTLLGTTKDDTISGLGGKDTIKGRNGDDSLSGGLGQDRISGGNGDDLITGGRGGDHLSGNGGRDTFIYESLKDGRDVITDFRARHDTIDLSAIFENTQYGSATPFEDYIRLGQLGNNTRLSVVDIAASGPSKTVFRSLATLAGVSATALDESNFLL